MITRPATSRRPARAPRRLALAALALASVLAVRPAHAWPGMPSVNVGVTGDTIATASAVRACSDGAQGLFVAWLDGRGPNHVFLQHLDATGTPTWATGGIEISTAGSDLCELTGVYADGSGGAIVEWIDQHANWYLSGPVWVQRVTAGGTRLWGANGLLVSPNTWLQFAGQWIVYFNTATGIADGAGGLYVAWSSSWRGSCCTDIYVQHVTAGGALSWAEDGVAVAETDWNFRVWPQLALDGAGGVIVAWSDNFSDGGTDIAAQRLDAAGNRLWSPNLGLWVTECYCDNYDAHVVAAPGGGAILSWTRLGCYDVHEMQRLDGAGNKLWSTSGIALDSTTTDSQEWQDQLVSDGRGGAILAYQHTNDCAGSLPVGVGVVRVDSTGATVWNADPKGVLVGTPRLDSWPSLISDGGGGAVVAWTHGTTGGYTGISNMDQSNDIYMQHIDATGALQDGATGVALTTDQYDQVQPVLVTDGGAGGIAVWLDYRYATVPNGATAARRAAVAGPTLFAQQANAVGVLGGPVIGVTAVPPIVHAGLLAIEGARPNPARDRLRIACTLSGTEPARLDVVDVAGRRLLTHALDAPAAGRQVVDLGDASHLAPGFYFVRLRQGAAAAEGRVLVVR